MSSRLANACLFVLIVVACGGTVSHQDEGGSAGFGDKTSSAGFGGSLGSAGRPGFGGGDAGVSGSFAGYGGDIIGVGGSAYGGNDAGGTTPYPYGGNAGYAGYGIAGTNIGSGYTGGFGAGGSSAGGEAGFAGEGGLCPDVPARSAPPYPITIEFTSSRDTFWMRQGCNLSYTLSSCSDYSSPLEIHPGCSATCNSGLDCMVCGGACASSAIQISPTNAVSDSLDGLVATLHTTASGCSCATYSDLPVGRYALSIPVYASQSDALGNVHPTQVTRYFTLQEPTQLSVDLSSP